MNEIQRIIDENSSNEMWWIEICGRIYMSHGKCSWKTKRNLIKSFKQSAIWPHVKDIYDEMINNGSIIFHKSEPNEGKVFTTSRPDFNG